MVSTRTIPNSPARRKRALLLSARDRADFAKFPPEAKDLLARVRYRDTVLLTQARQRAAELVRAAEALIPPAEMPAFLAEARAMSARGRIKLLDARGILLLCRNTDTQRTWPAMVAGINSPSGELVAVHRTWLEINPKTNVAAPRPRPPSYWTRLSSAGSTTVEPCAWPNRQPS
jgi:hypothetical protein